MSNMAHATKLTELVDGLITSITGGPTREAEPRQIRERTLKGLRDTSYGRTNQFDVQARLNGLVEKFGVLNRGDLAEGLQVRLNQLPAESQWLPEILSLLLELSNRPIEYTRFENVETASKSEAQQATLTWADIIADDPLDETGIWDDVERGYHSSDGDLSDVGANPDDETRATSFTEDDPATLGRRHVWMTDDRALDTVKAARDTSKILPTSQPVSELCLIRETFSMLLGLPTSLYNSGRNTDNVTPHSGISVATASRTVLQDTLKVLATIGASLNVLRRWTHEHQSAPTLRSCQSALESEMQYLALQISQLEQRYVTPQEGDISSLLEMRNDVERLARPFVRLLKLLQHSEQLSSSSAAALLDCLYDEVCIAQLAGDSNTFSIITSLLSAGLNTYLRPVSVWISSGECPNDDDFFVKDIDSNCGLGRMWHDRYTLRLRDGGEVAAPALLQPFIARIFATGKGRAFLKALAQDEEGTDTSTFAHSALSIFRDCNDLLPFSQVLEDTIQAWLDEQTQDQTPMLREAILNHHGLLQLPEKLQDMFFSKDGRRFQTFAGTLFWRLDHGSPWKDDFLLTEVAQTTLDSKHSDSDDRIALVVEVSKQTSPSQRNTWSSIRQLEVVHLAYQLPWPLQNVTASSRSETYTRGFGLLLQFYRARYLLRQHTFSLRDLDGRTTHLSVRAQALLKIQQQLSCIVDIFHAHITHTSEVLSTKLRQDLSQAEDIDAMATIWSNHEATLATSLLVADKLGPVREAAISVLELCERWMKASDSLAKAQGAVASTDGGLEDADVHALRKELASSLSFMQAGLRGVGRAGGNTPLEQLAERLEWAVHPPT